MLRCEARKCLDMFPQKKWILNPKHSHTNPKHVIDSCRVIVIFFAFYAFHAKFWCWPLGVYMPSWNSRNSTSFDHLTANILCTCACPAAMDCRPITEIQCSIFWTFETVAARQFLKKRLSNNPVKPYQTEADDSAGVGRTGCTMLHWTLLRNAILIHFWWYNTYHKLNKPSFFVYIFDFCRQPWDTQCVITTTCEFSWPGRVQRRWN